MNIEDTITEKIVKRLECCPNSYRIPNWSLGTFYVKFGWLRRIKCYDGISQVKVGNIWLSEENSKKVKDAARKNQEISLLSEIG